MISRLALGLCGIGVWFGLCINPAPPKPIVHVRLFQTGQQAIRPSQHHPALEYLADFPLIDQVPLSQAQQDSLYYLIAKAELFNYELMKSCPFEPIWAMEYGVDSSDSHWVLLSVSPCSKALFVEDSVHTWAVIDPHSPLEATIKQWGG